MIRKANNDDLDDCIKMGLEFCGMAGFEPSIEKIKSTIEQLIVNESLIVSGRPAVGMIGGMFYPHYFNDEIVAQELFWWVSPKNRGATGIKLLKAFEDLAKEKGCNKVMMISLEINDVSRVYKKRGYYSLEHTYMRSI